MDVDELYLDLLALRELYILLLKSCLRDANSELLDERAKFLLKHLLDDATAGLLEFLSKELAANSNMFHNFLDKDDKQTKPLDEKVIKWMKQNQTARKMGNPEIEHNPKRDRTSASNVAIDDLSHGISTALRRIELHILSLQHCTNQNRSNSKSHWQSILQGNESPNQQKVQPSTDPSILRSQFTKPIKGRSHLVGGQNVRPIMTHHCSEFVHGFRIPLSQGNVEVAMKPPTIETHMPKQHKVVNPLTLIDKSGCTAVGSKATTFRPAMKLNQTSIQQVKRNQNSYGHMVMGPTLLDHHPSREARKEQTHNKTHLATQQESELTSSEFESASSSSSWTTQQTTESETVDDGDDNSSSPCHHQDSPSTSDSKSSSRYSTKTFNIKHGKKEESKGAIGRFKRLKNKLGVIFHHHHHHHHHHHNSHNFMMKQLRKIFHHRDNKRLLLASKEDRNENVKKRAIRNVCYKNQVGRFQALAEGLRSHVWRSKAMKRKQLKGMKCGKKKKKKKGVMKLHWWKMFRNRRGVKLPNKGRMKIGYVHRKP